MARPARICEPSYVLLMVAIFVAPFGGGSLISGRQPIVAGVLLIVGFGPAVSLRVHRSRTGRWP